MADVGGNVVVAACCCRRGCRDDGPPCRHPSATIVLRVHQVALVPHLSSLLGFVVGPCMHLLVAHHCRCSGCSGSAHRHHVATAAANGAGAVAIADPAVVDDGVGAGAVLERRTVDATQAVHRSGGGLLPCREKVVRAGRAQVQVVEVLQAVRGRDHRVVLLLLAPPAAAHWLLRVRVVQACGGGARLERDGRPGGAVVVRAVRRRQGSAVAELRGDAANVVAHHAGVVVLRGRCGLGLLEALGGAADGEGAAVQDALHVVAAHVEVGDGVEAAELDRRDVVRLRCLLLGACIHDGRLHSASSVQIFRERAFRFRSHGACMHGILWVAYACMHEQLWLNWKNLLDAVA
jgi:hypothetical protein